MLTTTFDPVEGNQKNIHHLNKIMVPNYSRSRTINNLFFIRRIHLQFHLSFVT